MSNFEKVYGMTQHEGWTIVLNFIKKQVEICKQRLADENFADLQQVSKIQGEILGYKRILSFVNNRCEKTKRSGIDV